MPRPSPLVGSIHMQSLRSLDGVGRFTCLRVLRVSHHSLSSLEALASLSLLEDLDVSHNNLRRLSGLQGVAPTLKRLIASFNYIAKLPLEDVGALHALATLDLQDNSIAGLGELENLRQCTKLTQLRLENNPVISGTRASLMRCSVYACVFCALYHL